MPFYSVGVQEVWETIFTVEANSEQEAKRKISDSSFRLQCESFTPICLYQLDNYDDWFIIIINDKPLPDHYQNYL